MNDEIIKAFISDLESGAKYSPLPSEYSMEKVVERAKQVCPNTPDHIFHELLS